MDRSSPLAAWRRYLLLLLVAVVSMVGSLTALGQGLSALVQESNDFLPVEEAYHLEVEQVDATTLRLYWQIEPAYYLYQHRFKVAMADAQGEIGNELSYSPALAKTDEFFGDVEVYYDYADLRVSADRPFGLTRLAVTSQGCADAGLCYPPHTEVLSVDGATGSINSGEPEIVPTATTSPVAQDSPPSSNDLDSITLLSALVFAFLGGVILNAMPCVFPILSLKVLSFATGD